jgi:hypothetical protein
MLNRWFQLPGIFGVLLALMVQLGLGASVPQIDPVVTGAGLCHTDDSGGAPSRAPTHPADCPVCPLCSVLHVQATILAADAPGLPPPAIAVLIRPELPPPSTAPPAPHRPPSQPRAPPLFS